MLTIDLGSNKALEPTSGPLAIRTTGRVQQIESVRKACYFNNRAVCFLKLIESKIESVLSFALKKGRDSTFLLLRLSYYYCERGPLAAQLDRSRTLVTFAVMDICCGCIFLYLDS